MPQLRLVEHEIRRLRATYSELSRQHKAISSEIEAYCALISPGRRLPTKVLQAIFIECLPSQANATLSKNYAPILLTRICRGWRQVAFATPELWSSLHLPIPVMRAFPRDDPQSPEAYLYSDLAQGYEIEARRWLERTFDRPLSISLVDGDRRPRSSSSSSNATTLASEMVELIALFVSRWKNISIKAHIADLQPMLALPSNLMLQFLRSLSIECIHSRSFSRSYLSDPLESMSSTWKATPLLCGAPNLRELALIDIRQNFLDLPVCWGNLISLTLEANQDQSSTGAMSANSGIHHSPSDIASVLSQCPGLVECRVDIFGPLKPQDMGGMPHTLETISLPRLESLGINSHSSDLRWFLRSLDVPSLRRIEFHTQQSSSDLVFFLAHSSRNNGNIGDNILALATSPRSFTTSILTRCLAECPNLVSFSMKKWRMTEYDSDDVMDPFSLSSTTADSVKLDVSFLELLLSTLPIQPDQSHSTTKSFLCPNLSILDCLTDVCFSDMALLTFIKSHHSAYNSGKMQKRLKRISVRFRRPQEMLGMNQELKIFIDGGLVMELWYPREASPFRPKMGLQAVRELRSATVF